MWHSVVSCSFWQFGLSHTHTCTHIQTHTHTHTEAVCTSITKQTRTTVAVIYPSSTLRHSPCHIAEDVGADHHASPAPHLFPLLLQPLLQGLLQEHLRDERATASGGKPQRRRDRRRTGGVSSFQVCKRGVKCLCCLPPSAPAPPPTPNPRAVLAKLARIATVPGCRTEGTGRASVSLQSSR